MFMVCVCVWCVWERLKWIDVSGVYVCMCVHCVCMCVCESW